MGFPELVAGSVYPQRLILAETNFQIVVMARFSNGKLVLHSYFDKQNDPEIRDFFHSGKDAVKHVEELADITAYNQLVKDDLAVARLMRDTFPDGVPNPPDEVKRQMKARDHCGIYATNAWWIKKADGTVHITGNGTVTALMLPEKELGADPYPIAFEAIGWFFKEGKQRKLIIGEGIEEIRGTIYTDRAHEEEMETSSPLP